MKNRRLITLAVVMVIWQLAAMLVNKPLILPSPLTVAQLMIHQAASGEFYRALFATIFRVVRGLAVAFVMALAGAVASGMNRKFEASFEVINNIIKTVPNISYIILILVWLGSENSVTVITVFILFPNLYGSMLVGMKSVPQVILDMAALERMPFLTRLYAVYWPYLFPSMMSALKTAFGMGFKVSIMAEILGAVREGIGREMSFARTYVETGSIFAWTIWVIIVSMLVDALFDLVIRRLRPENEIS